jgi:hypothetical protein
VRKAESHGRVCLGTQADATRVTSITRVTVGRAFES